MIELTRKDDVFIATMNKDDNRFNPESLSAISEVLDEVESASTPSALVVTGTDKFFSNGLDLEAAQSGRADFGEIVRGAQALMARTLLFGRPTVAAINGHCFAAAALWSLCFDLSVMRKDRGFWCLPEVDIGFGFTPGMHQLITARLDPRTAHIAVVTGRRFGGVEARDMGIVDDAEAELEVLERAVEVAAANADKPTAILSDMKSQRYRQVAEALLAAGD